jgi:predicted amidohydrolase YtcJ
VTDLLITGAHVRTFDAAKPWAEAVGVSDGRISYVGNAADAPAASRRIDAGGRLITPGIIDSHNHLLLGFDEDAVSRSTRSWKAADPMPPTSTA